MFFDFVQIGLKVGHLLFQLAAMLLQDRQKFLQLQYKIIKGVLL